jgi:hypothetical protein
LPPDYTEALLRAILGTTARQVFPEARLAQIVAKGGGEKQLLAFNMCDGTKAQGDVAEAAGIDPGSFSRSVSGWIEAGVMIRLGEGRDAKLLHAYPLSKEAISKELER